MTETRASARAGEVPQMKLTRLKDYKSKLPVTLEKKGKKDCAIFRSEELNRMIDEQIEKVRREGYSKLVVPPRLHPIRPERLSGNTRRIAERLLDAGHRAYLSGGAVRDLLREEEVNDFDLATSATNEQLAALFDDIRFFTIPSGHRFGYVERDGEIVDISTLVNIPAAYRRLPHVPAFDADSLYSSSLLFDAYERDLTLNMIYYDIASGDVIDFFGGLYSLREGIIDTVIPGPELFRLDGRRAIRALRFAARFGFELSEAADGAFRRECPRYIRSLTPASVALELPDFYAGGFARRGTELFLKYGVFGDLFPPARDLAADPDYVVYILRTALGADWLYEEGTWALPMIVMAAMLWPAVRAAREAGADNPVKQVFDAQHAVMDMSEADAAYFMNTLAIEESVCGGEDIRSETLEIFDRAEFREGLRMLRLHYMSYRAGQRK